MAFGGAKRQLGVASVVVGSLVGYYVGYNRAEHPDSISKPTSALQSDAKRLAADSGAGNFFVPPTVNSGQGVSP